MSFSPALLAAVLVAVVILVILVVLLLVRRQRQAAQRPVVLPPLASTQGNSTSQSETVSRQTQEILLKLLNGDRTTAERLVQNVRNRNPDKSESWCWEKVISDLERDRR